MEPCAVQCLYGHRGRDPFAYDGSQCGCAKCPNFEMCRHWAPQWSLDRFDGRCAKCCISFDRDLTFRDGVEPCAVCTEVGREMVFPACEHAFCTGCSHKLLWGSGRQFYLDPGPYGCPPCPNGCDNPFRGKQCYCEERDDSFREWRTSKPEEYERWFAMNRASVLYGEVGGVYKCLKCPLCRAKFYFACEVPGEDSDKDSGEDYRYSRPRRALGP
jgi:hypothetical protein